MVRRVLRAALRRFHLTRPRPAILMYHRVAEVARDPWDLAVPPALFAAQMRFLQERRTVLPLGVMIDGLREGTLSPDAVAVTFDDGYRDNLVHAKPCLEQYGIHATLFVATGLIGSGCPLWWDELAAMILDAREPLECSVGCGAESVDLRWQAPEAGDAPGVAWKGWEPARTARQACFQQLWRAMKPLSQAGKEDVLQALRLHLRSDTDALAEPMTRQELLTMRASGLVTLAPHTVSHASLPTLTPDACRGEIVSSARACEALTGGRVSGFAYPYGDVTAEVSAEVEKADLQWACTTQAGFLRGGGTEWMRLPRMGASTCSLKEFAAQLRG